MTPPKLPVVSGPELVKFFENRGFEKFRRRGSHVIMRKRESRPARWSFRTIVIYRPILFLAT